MKTLQGSVVALITPMKQNTEVDYAALESLVEFHVANGTAAIVSVGTTGESATLSVDEHLEVIAKTINFARDRLPVIAGTGGNSTQEAIHLTRAAYNLGADAALLVVPYYNKPNQEGIYRHFAAIAEAVPIAQVLYNVPSRTVADMQNATINRLADFDNIIACKDATGDLRRGAELIQMCADRIDILSGDDATALELMRLGAKGDISVTANVAPAAMQSMCQAASGGEFAAAEEIDQQLQPLHRALFVESNPIPVKYAVSKMAMCENVLRLPLVPLSEENRKQVDAAAMPYTTPPQA